MHDAHVRRKVLELRARGMSIDEIAERLALSRTTVYAWVRGTPLGRPTRPSAQAAGEASRRIAKARREAAYEGGRASWGVLSREPAFRDFVCLYLAEGSKRCRNRVAICNSDPAIMRLAVPFVRRFTTNALRFSVQVHEDQDLEAVKHFWAGQVGIAPDEVHLQRKTNSGRLGGRTWRSVYGVLTVSTGDTMFRARLEAWMDELRRSWA
jgi:transcriptional regulator with XRE-family HTH domain